MQSETDMRLAILALLISMSATGCGKKNFASSKTSASSVAPNVVNYPDNDNVNLNTGGGSPPAGQPTNSELDGIAGVIGNLISEIFDNLQGLNGNFQFTNNGINASFGFYCQGGGSVALTAQAQTSANIGLSSVQAALLSGSGSLVFSLCKLVLPNGEQLSLDGALQVSQLTGALSANYSMAGSANFTVNSSSQWAGNIHVSVGTFDQACAFNGQQSGSGSGTVSPAQNFMPSGTHSFQLQGQICGVTVSDQFSASY